MLKIPLLSSDKLNFEDSVVNSRINFWIIYLSQTIVMSGQLILGLKMGSSKGFLIRIYINDKIIPCLHDQLIQQKTDLGLYANTLWK